jgi:integrase
MMTPAGKRPRKPTRASFGTVRQLPSGRWQARYHDAAGHRITAPVTFATKRDAEDHLAAVRSDRMRGTYRDHRAGLVPLGEYAREWIANGGSRGRLSDGTRRLYEDLLRRQLESLAATPLNGLTAPDVRAWYSKTRKTLQASSRARGGTGEARTRQAYALLKAIMATAVADGLIPSNPCQIKGAGIANSEERPYMPPEVLDSIIARMPDHYDVPMRLMFGAHLRLGEMVALERGDYDPKRRTLRVERQAATADGVRTTAPTKTGEARVVAIPPSLAVVLEGHLASTTGFPRSPLFARADGSVMTTGQVQQAWSMARARAGHPQYHVHDVRHAGLTLAAQAGATTRELMARAGHRTARASLIYQHAAEERNQVVAERMDALTRGGLGGNPRLEAVIRLDIPVLTGEAN